MHVTAVFAYIFIIYWLCQLLSCNFASLCVLAASVICGFSIRESFSTAHSQATLFISAALQTFCCCITEISFFSQLCVIFTYFFCVCSISPSSCLCAFTSAAHLRPFASNQQMTKSTNKTNASLLRSAIMYSLLVLLCFACQLS